MNITGKYDTNNGVMVIEEINSQVTGQYAQNGIISGKINGATLTGVWENNGQKGLFEFKFDDENTFNGKYKKGVDDGIMRGKWSGKKLEIQNSTLDNDPKDIGEFKKIQYESGSSYEGYVLNGQRHGYGVYSTWNGITEEGEFMNGELNGKGKKTYIDIDNPDLMGTRIYEGEFKDGKLNGMGKYTSGSGDVYEGEFKNDQLNGKGIISTDSFIQEGEFKDNYLNGKGSITYIGEYKHKGTYEGDFVNDKWEGYGICRYGNGDVYEGEWKNKKRHGSGTFFEKKSDSVREGKWFEDKPVLTEEEKKKIALAKKEWKYSIEYVRKTDKGNIETRTIKLISKKNKLTKAEARLHILSEDALIKRYNYKFEGILEIKEY
jgi:hypothetical protein